jgi:chromosome segregation ATPase
MDDLEDENAELKAQAEEIHDRSMTHVNESKSQEKELERLKKEYEKKVVILREKERELERLRSLIEQRREEISGYGKELNRLQSAIPISASRTQQRQSWGGNGEKSHVVKVLEHESKIFKFESNVNDLGTSLQRYR